MISMQSTSHVLVVVVCLIGHTAAIPRTRVQQMTSDFTDALTDHDLTTAARLYDVIQRNDKLNATAFTLATAMKTALDSPTFQHLSQDERFEFSRLRDRLPRSTRNAVFEASICLRNDFWNELLYASNRSYVNETSGRHSFTRPLEEEIDDAAIWTLEATSTVGEYNIRNLLYGEHLFASEVLYDVDRRWVFTWIPDLWELADDQRVWRMTTEGDFVRIQNKWFENVTTEYLYPSTAASDLPYERYVFSNLDEVSGSAFNLWEISDC